MLFTNPLRLDPSRTVSIRKGMNAEVRRRLLFAERLFLDDIRTGSWRLGNNREKLETIRNKASAQYQKIPGFMSLGSNDTWIKPYIQRSYEQGLRRSFLEMSPPIQEGLFHMGREEQFVRTYSNMSEVMDLIADQAHNEIKGIVDQALMRIARAATVMIQLSDVVTFMQEVKKIGRKMILPRSNLAIQFSTISSHAEGQLDGYDALGVRKVLINAEQLAPESQALCSLCRVYERKEMTVEEARGLLPMHPNCKCAFRAVKNFR